MNSFRDRLQEIKARIFEAERRSGRQRGVVALMAVTKTRTTTEIQEAWREGIRLFGENRIQEALPKKKEWPEELSAEWHLIGYLQRNKARKALDLFSRIDSLDRAELAFDLQRILEEKGKPVEVLIEVNTSGESSKHGVSPSGIGKLVESILRECPLVVPRGMMTVGPLGGDLRAVGEAFALLRELKDKVSVDFGVQMPDLSMGMSDDYELAIEQGSTCVRLGRALFGPREFREG